MGANDKYPQSLLGGDRNLGGAGILNGVGNPTANYGFSAVTGTQDDAWLGADVKLGTDGKILEEFNYLGAGVYVSNYCDWSLKMHSYGDPVGAGDILLGDGSAHEVTSLSFRRDWLQNATDSGNYQPNDPLAEQLKPIRLVFP